MKKLGTYGNDKQKQFRQVLELKINQDKHYGTDDYNKTKLQNKQLIKK